LNQTRSGERREENKGNNDKKEKRLVREDPGSKSMPKRLTLTEQFDNPGIRVGLDILLILARTLDESLSGAGKADLFDRSEEGSWLEVIEQLGRLQADPNSRVSDKNKIDESVGSILRLKSDQESVRAGTDFRSGGVSQEVFVYAKGAEILSSIWSVPMTRDTTSREKSWRIANWKNSSLRSRRRTHFYDEPGEHYCAGTNPETRTIYWAFQRCRMGWQV